MQSLILYHEQPYIVDLDEVSIVKVELSLTLDPEGSVQTSMQNRAELTEWKNGRGVVWLIRGYEKAYYIKKTRKSKEGGLAQSHIIFDGG